MQLKSYIQQMDEVHYSTFSHRFMWSRTQPRHVPADSFALEPWQKNTVQFDGDHSQNKKYKTFYQTPKPKQYSNKNIVPQVLNHRNKQIDLRHIEITKKVQKFSQSPSSRKCIVNPYNINDELIVEATKNQKNGLPNQFFMRKNKLSKQKQKDLSLKKLIQPIDSSRGVSLSQMRRRVSSRRESQSPFRLQNMNRMTQMCETSQATIRAPLRRKNKVISLGYQKLFSRQGLVKHHSVQLKMTNLT